MASVPAHCMERVDFGFWIVPTMGVHAFFWTHLRALHVDLQIGASVCAGLCVSLGLLSMKWDQKAWHRRYSLCF